MNGAAGLTLAFFLTVACDAGKSDRRDTSAAAIPRSIPATPPADSSAPAPTQSVAAATSPNAASCVSEGTWQACSVEKRLTDAGFVPIAKGPAPTGVFDIRGTRYALGAAELDVYVFDSATARETAVAAIDTVTVTRGGGASPWTMPPTFITSNNLVAVLLSDNGRLIERVQLAITAGLPSAAR